MKYTSSIDITKKNSEIAILTKHLTNQKWAHHQLYQPGLSFSCVYNTSLTLLTLFFWLSYQVAQIVTYSLTCYLHCWNALFSEFDLLIPRLAIASRHCYKIQQNV